MTGSEPVIDERVRRVINTMRVDVHSTRVISALQARGIEPILLKGPVIARWLFDQAGERMYGDSDLLVEPRCRRAAEAVLKQLGHHPAQYGWFGKARAWTGKGGSVDLHTSIVGIEVDDEEAWRVLSREAEAFQLSAVSTRCLAPAGRALHLALHRSGHEAQMPGPSEDLQRGLAKLPEEVWVQAAALARELRAEAAFTDGLRRAGAASLLERLGLAEVHRPLVASILASSEPAPPTALGIGQLLATRGLRSRLLVLRQGVFPSRVYMRTRYPGVADRFGGLTWSYVARLSALARHVPRGIAACWRVRSPDPRPPRT